jgi:hypothetical protein
MTTIHCPKLHINDVGEVLKGCGEEFVPYLTDGYAMCPSCGLTYEPPTVPFGVHWTGEPFDPIERVDMMDEGENSDPIFDGDVAAAIAVAHQTIYRFIVYIHIGTWTSDDRDESEQSRWEVYAWDSESKAKTFIEGAPKGSIMFDSRTHHLESDPTITEPNGYGYVVENGKHLEACGQCHNDLITKTDGDTSTGKYPNMCSTCVLSEI